MPDDASLLSASQDPALQVCGPRCVYLMARSSGLKMTSENLSSLCQKYPSGMSLAQLQTECDNAGLSLSLRRLVQSDLAHQLPLPLITHLATSNTSATGHFVLVTQISPTHVVLMDPTTVRQTIEPIQQFNQSWSGYCLITKPSTTSNSYLLPAIALLIVLLCLLFVRHQRWYLRS